MGSASAPGAEPPRGFIFSGAKGFGARGYRRGRSLFAKAAEASPKNPLPWLGLAFACRQMNDDPGEMAALTSALTADPYCYPALLAKGAVCERQGLLRQAAKIYKNVLSIMPPEEELAPQLRANAEHARQVVSRNTETLDAFLEERLGQLWTRHAGADVRRMLEAKDAMIGKRRIYTSEASLYRVPGIPAVPFFDRSFFPWMEALEAQTEIIRDELHALLQAHKQDFAPYLQYPADAPLEQWAELNRSYRWSSLYLMKDGERVEENCALCPLTMAALEQVPLASIPGGEPVAMFSALEPHTHIPPHVGITNARTVVHLPLILPGECRFRVGNETREWKLGEAWAFDDSMEHEAFNDSGELRVILIFNVWNPYLSLAERDFAAAMISGYYDYLKGDGAK